MDIRQLRYFVEVACSGSLSKAAVALGIAKPSRLKERLGIG